MKFTASTRSVHGSSASRRLRHAGQVPAIVYGGDIDVAVISLDHNQIYHDLRKDAFHASILDMDLDGKTEKVILRAVQWHPYKQQVLHVDFQRVRADQELTTNVPFAFLNGDESPAVKLHAQVISHVLNDLSITCLPANLPVSIEVDLSQLDDGQTITLEDITLPEGVTYAAAHIDPNPTLVTVMAVRGAAAEDDAEAGAEESGDEPAAE